MNPVALTTAAKSRRLNLADLKAIGKSFWMHEGTWRFTFDGRIIIHNEPKVPSKSSSASVVHRHTQIDVFRITYRENATGKHHVAMYEWGKPLGYLAPWPKQSHYSWAEGKFTDKDEFHKKNLKGFLTVQNSQKRNNRTGPDFISIPHDLCREYPRTPQDFTITRIDLYAGEKVVMR